jgi:hypothetical protein
MDGRWSRMTRREARCFNSSFPPITRRRGCLGKLDWDSAPCCTLTPYRNCRRSPRCAHSANGRAGNALVPPSYIRTSVPNSKT